MTEAGWGVVLSQVSDHPTDEDLSVGTPVVRPGAPGEGPAAAF